MVGNGFMRYIQELICRCTWEEIILEIGKLGAVREIVEVQ